MVRQILDGIVGGMQEPDRPSSPIDAYITDEEIFHRNNPKVGKHLGCLCTGITRVRIMMCMSSFLPNI